MPGGHAVRLCGGPFVNPNITCAFWRTGEIPLSHVRPGLAAGYTAGNTAGNTAGIEIEKGERERERERETTLP